MESGPLLPQSPVKVTPKATDGQQKLILVPLDYVKSRVKIVKDDLLAEEEAFVAISKAAETFLRNLARESSNLAGNEPISYDDIANVVHKLPFHELREFLPQRMTYEAVQRRLQALQENRDENDEDDDD